MRSKYLTVFLLASAAFAATPVGKWLTIDDETGKPRSEVLITNLNNHLSGQIVKVFYRAGESPDDRCVLCSGAQKNQKILGMTILNGLIQINKNTWSNGEITDPHNGKIYRCKMTLSENNKSLVVRGYIGIPLLGRSQTWERLED